MALLKGMNTIELMRLLKKQTNPNKIRYILRDWKKLNKIEVV